MRTLYEPVHGCWSGRPAPLLIGFGGLADGEGVLDVCCGTGSLTFALPAFANLAEVTGIDSTEPFVAAALARGTDPRVTFDLGDARALPLRGRRLRPRRRGRWYLAVRRREAETRRSRTMAASCGPAGPSAARGRWCTTMAWQPVHAQPRGIAGVSTRRWQRPF